MHIILSPCSTRQDDRDQGHGFKFDITTPHSWLYIVAADGTNWSFESEGPGALARAGLHHSTLKVGDKVEVTTHPMRDRANVGSDAQRDHRGRRRLQHLPEPPGRRRRSTKMKRNGRAAASK